MIARIEPCADERLDARHREFLILGVGQIDHLRDEVSGGHLVEVFFRQLKGHCVVREIGCRPRGYRGDLKRRVEFDSFTTRNVGHLEAVDAPLGKVVATRCHERLGVEAAGHGGVPADLHSILSDKADL